MKKLKCSHCIHEEQKSASLSATVSRGSSTGQTSSLVLDSTPVLVSRSVPGLTEESGDTQENCSCDALN